MNLPDTLKLIANQLNIDAAALIEAAKEDYQTGWDNGAGAFPIGSLFGVEGQTLYALVRVLKPETIYELGTHYGASTTHLALAVHMNGAGRITSVDNNSMIEAGNVATGSMIPPDLLQYVDLINDDAIARLAAMPPESVDFIFEDLTHYAEDCEKVGKLAQFVLKPGGLLIAHDAVHPIVGGAVQEGYLNANINIAFSYLTEPSDCGLLVWQKPLTSIANVVETASKKRTRKGK